MSSVSLVVAVLSGALHRCRLVCVVLDEILGRELCIKLLAWDVRVI